MKRIAVIEDGYIRDVQVFTENPDIIETDPSWENNFRDVKNPCLYVGIFEGIDEDEIKKKAANAEGVHPDVITLKSFDESEDKKAEVGGIFDYERLRGHIGHAIEVVTYAERSVSVECIDCNEVLLSIDNPKCAESNTGCDRATGL